MNLPARQIAESLIRQLEGCVLHPYQDSGGTWTIGIGSTLIDGKPVTAHTPPITSLYADTLLMGELAQKADAVEQAAPHGATNAQIGACISFAYNVGVSAFLSSTLLKLWRAGDIAGAAEQFASWVYAGGKFVRGLANRRAMEKAVFLGAVKMAVPAVPAVPATAPESDADKLMDAELAGDAPGATIY